ncbi:MAG TPA: biotin carboxylase N-terminal domain-containing protein [Candidatus Humimicrobiaceae bacterium]|nr:biotin carboxylase N-terminal domain-containing protein [Candidatus Humimicrobiaceae bacterium]
MFNKILIANRGEIAIRIIRTCKELGIKTVALCPQKGEEDNFLETELANEFYYLDEAGATGYLNQRKIIEIAKRAGAEAVHPGYGFLAQNGDFAELCRLNGIKFIGPTPETLRKIGDKVEAKKIAWKVGIPLLPGPQRAIDEKECFKVAKKTKPPFLLKAVDGGGGIGMTEIHRINKEEIMESFQRLKRTSESAFNSKKIFIEKLLISPRHIEFQILGDGRGKVLHLGERECSIQRRHQKLVEEAPSPFLDSKLRERMGSLAVKLGQHLNYEGAGTVEFLVDRDRNFYFLEVNPRLQVEHPVTELITNFDLVELQIRVASGEKLDFKQKHIKFFGWAMEFRIYAEDALADFHPLAGQINKYLPPGGKGIEIHSFCRAGQKVLPYFDPLLAKLVVFAKDRRSVIRRARRAFQEYIIEGVPTLIPFYKTLLGNQSFLEGRLSTDFIEREKILEILKEKNIPQKIIVFEKILASPEGRKAEKEKAISDEEVARLAAKFYQNFRGEKTEPEPSMINKWKLAERMSIFEE